MRTYLTLFVPAALGVGSFAGEIRKGAMMQVKPNMIRACAASDECGIFHELVRRASGWAFLMKRRELMVLLGAAAWPLAARAQQPALPVVTGGTFMGLQAEDGRQGPPILDRSG